MNTYMFTCMYAYYGYRFVHVHTRTHMLPPGFRVCFHFLLKSG